MYFPVKQFLKAALFAPLCDFLSKAEALAASLSSIAQRLSGVLAEISSTSFLGLAGSNRLFICFLNTTLAIFLFTQNSSAQSCPTYSWPTISAAWSLGPDNYYTAGGVGGGAVAAGDTCACPAVNVPGDPNCKIYIDGIALSSTIASCGGWIPFGFTIPDGIIRLSEGSHYAELRFTAYGCDKEQDYASPSKTFFVDKTLPIVTLVKPENNVVISTVNPMDLIVKSIVSDSDSKVGVVSVQLNVSGGPCHFNHDYFGAAVTAASISGGYCSSYFYTGEANQLLHNCVADIGTVSNYTLSNSLLDYVDFSQGQDCRFSVSVGGIDRVANQAETKNLSFWVDQAPPAVAINEPVLLSTGLHWSTPAIISGTAADLSNITSVWLTIKDEGTKRFWDGGSWVASRKWFNGSSWVETDIKVNATMTGTTNVAWEYAHLANEVIHSGIYTITAYARDKFGHVGHAVLSGKNRGKYDLGEEEFASLSMVVKEVRNNKRNPPDNPYSFTSKTGDNNIFVSAEISPARLAGTLDNYVLWNVYGTNAYSGKPDAPHGGNPSDFLVQIPPVVAMPLGRPGPMEYTVFPRIEYDYEDVHREYYGPNHATITQDDLDRLRQEYLDFGTIRGAPERFAFDDLSADPYPGLLGAAAGSYGWHIIKTLKTQVKALADTLASIEGGLLALRVTSGYRTPKLNPGSKTSNHMYGEAFDYNQFDDSWDNFVVWQTARGTGPHENLLYEDSGKCFIKNQELELYDDFPDLPAEFTVYCYSKKSGQYTAEDVRTVNVFSLGHISWQ